MKSDSKFSTPILDVLSDKAAAAVELSDVIIKNNQGSFEDYISKKTAELDRYIIEQESVAKLIYVAGEVSLNFLGVDEFFMKAQFYFKSANGEWVKKEISGKPLKASWELLPDFQSELSASKVVSFEYERPSS